MIYRSCLMAAVATIAGLMPVSLVQNASADCGSGGCSVSYGYNNYGCGAYGCSVNYNQNYQTYYPGQWIRDNQYGWVQVVSVGPSKVATPAVRPVAKAPTSVANGVVEDKPVPVTVDETKPKKPKAPTNRDE